MSFTQVIAGKSLCQSRMATFPDTNSQEKAQAEFSAGRVLGVNEQTRTVFRWQGRKTEYVMSRLLRKGEQ